MSAVQMTAEPVATRSGVDGGSPGDPAGTRRRGFLPALGAVAAVLGGAALIAIHAALYGSWIMDDAAITFAYSRNLAEGFGPVLQPGALPVEGFSNPTWMLLLALGKLVGLFDHGTLFGVPDYVLFPKGLALLCCIALLTLIYLAAKTVSRHPRLVTFAAGALLAAMPSFVIWAFSGLENSFYALTVVALAVVMLRAVVSGTLLSSKVAAATGVIAALAALTRPDGMIYVFAFPIVVALFIRRPTVGAGIKAVLISAVGFVVPFGGYLLFRWLEYGRLLANTAVAKAQPLPTFDDIAKAGDVISYAGWLLVAVCIVCLAAVMLRPSKVRSALVAVLAPFGLAVVAFCVLQSDWMGQLRFATPIWVLGALGGSIAVAEVLSRARVRGRIVLTFTLVIAAAASVSNFYTQGTNYLHAVKTPFCVVAERDARTMNGLADILKLPNSASIGVIDLGGQAMTSRLQVVDLAGLGDKEIANYLGRDDLPGMRNYTFGVVKPAMITFIEGWGDTLGFPGDPRFSEGYELIYRTPRTGVHAIDSMNYVGYWVRKDLVTDEAQLTQLTTYAQQRVDPIVAMNLTAPRRTCGANLRPGQTS